MKFPAYPCTKPSGIEWIGDVPETWDVKRTKWSVLGCINGVWGDEPNGVDDVTCVRVADFDRDKFLVVDEPPTLRAIEPNQLKTRHLRKGDLLIEKSGGGEKQLVGCVVSFTHDFKAVCSNFVARLPVLPELPPRFWCYVHAALYAGKLNYPAIKQTTGIQNLDSGAYLDTPAPFPPPLEQRSIAAFLDGETARIDRLVAKKKELIERLKEKRTALISRTVTRGLNPSAPFKSSGIDWLGDIPKHWEVKPVKFVARIGNGSTPNRDNPSYWEDGDYPWLNSSVVNQETITEAEEFVTSLALRECHLPQIKPPAVLIGITGQGRTRGMASTLMFAATINQHIAYLKPYPSCAEVCFLRRVFDMAYLFLRSESDGGGSTKGAITCEQIANLKIPLPSLPEQAAIAAYLDLETAKLDTLVVKVEEAVERLQEYRTALITAAVTGKIDVRKEATL